MAKVSQLTSKTLQATICIFLLVLTFDCASSARILDEVSQVADASSEIDEPVVAPVVAPATTLPRVATAAPGGTTGAATSGAKVESPILEHPTFSFFMHDILGGSLPSGRVVTGIVATSDANNLPFSKLNNQIFPINGGQQANTVLQNSGNNDVVTGDDTQPFVTAGQLPSGLSLQQLMFGSITVVDNELTEGHELGSSVLGRAQGFYLTSSSDGTSHTLALTTLFHGEHNHEVDDTISFFGIHRTATPISHIAIIGGTGKYENAKGFATIETLPHVDQHTTDGLETITHFTVYITP
uniref:Dirigent protein n=1 Tax=Solanum lycopersicum TaxID=4081 RepID=A0A3Q7GQ66_SOLLC